MLELGLLVGGLLLYLRGTSARDAIGRFGPWVFAGLLSAVQIMMFFGRPPRTANQAAGAALVSYLVFAALAAWLDRHREAAVSVEGRAAPSQSQVGGSTHGHLPTGT
jgi:hypothetical protein